MIAPSITLPILWENAANDAPSIITHDLPALHLKAGQNVTLRPVASVDADAIFAFRDGNLARVQTLFNGTYRVTDTTGAMQVIPRADLPPVSARLIHVRADTPAKEVTE